MRAAQSRYEETLADTHNKMVAISEMEATQQKDLIGFIEAQLTFFKRGIEILEEVREQLKTIK
jgi:hypothetical protein